MTLRGVACLPRVELGSVVAPRHAGRYARPNDIDSPFPGRGGQACDPPLSCLRRAVHSGSRGVLGHRNPVGACLPRRAFAPILPFAGIMKGLLALATQIWPAFATDGAYTVLYTVADGMFYFLPIVLAITASRKFKLSEFTGLAIGLALVYPTMVSLTGGEIIGSVGLGFFGTFQWYATFFGIPIIMPASGYTSSVIPVILMVWFGSVVEHWAKKWMPASVKMLFTPLLTMTATIVLGYFIIGPVATLITNILSSIFMIVFNLPVVGGILGCTLVGAFWMCLVIFGFHWSLIPLCIVNLTTIGYDFILSGTIGHSFALGAIVFAMYLKNKDENFRGIALPAAISAFFFGITEPAIYGVALPNKKAFVLACCCSAVCGAIMGIFSTYAYMSGGLGVFSWFSSTTSTRVCSATA